MLADSTLSGMPELARTYSVEELTALAEIAGRPAFPATRHVFGSDAERTVARRALLARGTLELDGPDRLRLADSEARLILTPLRAAAAIAVEWRSAGAAQTFGIHLAANVSVLHEPAAGGLHRLTPVLTPLVGNVVARLTRLVERPVCGQAPIRMALGEYHQALAEEPGPSERSGRLAELLGAGSSTARVRRAGTGDEVIWHDAGQRGLWVLRTDDRDAVLEPVAAGALARKLSSLWAA